jgi:hypothetical protein
VRPRRRPLRGTRDDRRESGNHPWPRAPAHAGTKILHVSKMRRVDHTGVLGTHCEKPTVSRTLTQADARVRLSVKLSHRHQ